MAGGYFITGTDTDCGKTEITLGVIRRLQQQGLRVAGMKPVAAGAEESAEGARNGDALRIAAAASVPAAYSDINPYLFAPPIAPHIAAQQAGVAICFDTIAQAYGRLAAPVDRVVVEGAGGWQVPLGEEGSIGDLARHLRLPVLLVVGLKLGCLNHALLSVESIEANDCRLAGWVANTLDPAMAQQSANIATLQRMIGAPLLGVVPHLSLPGAEHVAEHLVLG